MSYDEDGSKNDCACCAGELAVQHHYHFQQQVLIQRGCRLAT
jgi:hypothetical protein